MADEFDRRPERTPLPRRLIEKLLEEKDVELTLIHSKRMQDEPIYQKAREILLPRIELPWATRFVSFVRFCLTTNEEFDIVHYFVPRVFPFFWLFPAKHTTVMMHGGGDVLNPGIWTIERVIFNYTLKWFHRYVAAAIAVSDYGNREIIYAYGIPPYKVHTIYNPLDPTFLVPPDEKRVEAVRSKYDLGRREYFMYLGRCALHKNVGNLVNAYLIYRRENPKSKELLVIAGDTKEEYERAFGALPESPFSSDIRFLDYVPGEDLPALYRGAKALSFVTLNEGFGVPVIEAFASGTPVIVASTTSLPEVAGDAAIIVGPHDPHALASAMKLVGDPLVRSEMIRRGYARSRFFTWEKTYGRTLGLFRTLMEEKRPVALPPKNERHYLMTPLPEALDKFSILTLKRERLPKDASVEKEYEFYRAVIEEYKLQGISVKDEWIKAMIDINGQCWDMEAAIRQGRDQELGLEEIGRRTIKLRDLNKIRIARKNEIADEIGLDFFEVKVDHASQ